jgi:hypothetical protein
MIMANVLRWQTKYRSYSALYGEVSLRFILKVDHGNTFTLWPIILIL